MTLTREQIAVQVKFAGEVSADPELYFRLYRERFGKILDTDNARELSEDYRASKESRARLAGAVHEVAGTLVWQLWLAMLDEEDPSGNERVLLTAGGAGAGKTATVARLVGNAFDVAQIIYDTTLADLDGAAEKIETALAAGKLVTVIYVHRLIEQAVRGVIERAAASGRCVPLPVLADNHFDAQRTLRDLARRYEGEPRVEILVINNSGELTQAAFAPLDFLRKRFYKKRAAARRRAWRAARAEFRRRARMGREIPDYIYEAIFGEKQRKEGSRPA